MATLSQRFLEQFVLDLIMQKSVVENTETKQNTIDSELKASPIINIETEIPKRTIHPVYPQQPLQSQQNTYQQIPLSKSFEKISMFLQDPKIQGVECTGPNKNVLVNTDGIIRSTNTILTKEEIDSIMQEISQKTRIPLINGVFKAAFNNYVLTAVVSEFIGTRFVIQKRNQFHQLKAY